MITGVVFCGVKNQFFQDGQLVIPENYFSLESLTLLLLSSEPNTLLTIYFNFMHIKAVNLLLFTTDGSMGLFRAQQSALTLNLEVKAH